jgi:UDP-2-acetamido-3-amino-2,3-dideoxy-glucuronate N-acetyltransferase
VCGVTIGKYAFVGAGSVVTKNIKDYALVVGVPAMQIGWMSGFGERIEIPLGGQGTYICKNTGDSYQVSEGICRKI